MKIERKRPMYHPGSYVEDAIDALSMTRHECAGRLNMSDKELSELISGEHGLTAETARKLGGFFGTEPELWINLQNRYEMYVAEQAEEYGIESDRPYLDHLDYAYFVRSGMVPASTDWHDRIVHLRKALRVARLSALAKPDLLAMCRQATPKDGPETIVPRNAWMTIGLDRAAGMKTAAFDRKRFDAFVQETRRAVTLDDGLEERLSGLAADCGIALVILPEMPHANVNGVVKWIDADHVVLLLNAKGKYADIFWFSLFHELGHVRQMKKRLLIVDGEDEALEAEADAFARDVLIPPQPYAAFIGTGIYSEAAVLAFSASVGIDAGIVVGRLQKEGRLPYSHLNGLRKKIDLHPLKKPS